MKQFYVYMMSNWPRGVIYVGVTSAIQQRVVQHKLGDLPGFTAKYRATKLVFAEPAPDATSAIRREKQIKSWSRAKKIALVESENPNWVDLAGDWFAQRASE